MAKIKVRPRPGALSELLKTKGMTQMDAFEKTRVDRKTLSKIDRGQEVKLETLQQVVIKLKVTEEHFLPTRELIEDADDPEPGTILLRRLDVARLQQLLQEDPKRIKWHLNAKVRDHEARKFLEEFETAVEKFRTDLLFSLAPEELSLRRQLTRLETADDIAVLFDRLAEHGLAVLGGSHLFWECSYEESSYEDVRWLKEEYHSSSTIVLSVEPFGTQSRREHTAIGHPPPIFAPDTETAVFVNGVQLPSLEEL